MKPIDMLGFGPSRTVKDNADGTFTVKVTPPATVGGEGVSTTLTADQYRRYQEWQNRGALIQEALPELSGSQLEALMTGLTDDEFAGAVKPPPTLADRIEAYLEDHPSDGGHSDAAGASAWELLQEALDELRSK